MPDDDLRHGDAADLTGRRYVYGLRLPHEGREAAIRRDVYYKIARGV